MNGPALLKLWWLVCSVAEGLQTAQSVYLCVEHVEPCVAPLQYNPARPPSPVLCPAAPLVLFVAIQKLLPPVSTFFFDLSRCCKIGKSSFGTSRLQRRDYFFLLLFFFPAKPCCECACELETRQPLHKKINGRDTILSETCRVK